MRMLECLVVWFLTLQGHAVKVDEARGRVRGEGGARTGRVAPRLRPLPAEE